MMAVTNRRIILWNMAGSVSTAAISVLLLIVVSRFLPASEADLFAFAYALGNMLVVIGLFQVRNYQATDIERRYSFQTYAVARIQTCLAMIIVASVYLLITSADEERATVVMLVTLYRLTDAVSDLYQGLFQQEERLDVAGKSLVYRNSLIFLIFTVVLFFTKRLEFALAALLITSVGMILLFDNIQSRQFSERIAPRQPLIDQVVNSWSLLRENLPLFINGFLLIYIYNQPRYVLDRLYLAGQVDAGLQTIFSILFMPAFVMNLMMLFFRPLITDLALALSQRDVARFHILQRKLFLFLGLASFVVLLGAGIIGLPVLEVLYGVSLNEYWLSFMLLMLGGVLGSFVTAIDNILTAMRQQRVLVVAYGLAFVVAMLISAPLIGNKVLIGAALSFLITTAVWLALSVAIFYSLKFKRKN
ncbi:lipopolysaccharide biosynthesis protein [Streptococcus sp. E17BB]|uniref:lipopolysaccharide biosynthesis protein n=1 Tax=Streptococcus sp. E17BB TaxID=3278714 RepID=UPI00359D1B1F